MILPGDGSSMMCRDRRIADKTKWVLQAEVFPDCSIWISQNIKIHAGSIGANRTFIWPYTGLLLYRSKRNNAYRKTLLSNPYLPELRTCLALLAFPALQIRFGHSIFNYFFTKRFCPWPMPASPPTGIHADGRSVTGSEPRALLLIQHEKLNEKLNG